MGDVGPLFLVNCPGPKFDYDRIRDPLIRSRPRTPGFTVLEIDPGEYYRVVGSDGAASEVLFALRPPIRGNLRGMTTAPDIRKPCEAVARHPTRTAA